MNREFQIGGVVKLLVAAVAIAAAVFSAWACVDMQMIHAAVGTIALLVVLSPFLVLRTYDLFSPWSFVIWRSQFSPRRKQFVRLLNFRIVIRLVE